MVGSTKFPEMEAFVPLFPSSNIGVDSCRGHMTCLGTPPPTQPRWGANMAGVLEVIKVSLSEDGRVLTGVPGS